MQQVGVAPGHQQRHTLGQRSVFVHVGGQMPAQMVDGVERHSPRSRIRFGRSDSHQQRAGQPGPDGGRDDIGPVQTGARQRATHGGTKRLQVRPGGDLGDHAAEPDVLVDAGGDLVGQHGHGAIGVQARDADTRFVARGFDGQDVGHKASRRIVYASAPLTR